MFYLQKDSVPISCPAELPSHSQLWKLTPVGSNAVELVLSRSSSVLTGAWGGQHSGNCFIMFQQLFLQTLFDKCMNNKTATQVSYSPPNRGCIGYKSLPNPTGACKSLPNLSVLLVAVVTASCGLHL